MLASSPWPARPLGELAELTVGFVGSMASQYVPNGVPFLRSLNVRPFRIEVADLMFVDEEFNARLRKSALRPGDVVVVRTGTPGVAAVIPDWLPRANCADLVVIRPGPQLDSRFLAYYINGAAQGHVDAHAVGAVQQHYNVGSAKQMLVSLPPLDEQRAIGAALGAIDDKIAVNRRVSQRVEELAGALFHSWFVDYEPVVARADGRTVAGIERAAFDAFPTSFEESRVGPIPRGWRVAILGDECHVTMGQSPPGSTYNLLGDGLPFFQGSTDFTDRFPAKRVFCSAPTRIAQRHDTLISVRAPVGRCNMASEECAIGRGVAAVRHRSGSRSFTYYLLRELRPEFEVFNGDGTIFGSISGPAFRTLPIVVPTQNVVQAFELTAAPLDDLYAANEVESQNLAALRTTILPRLLSGEIRLADVERAVGDLT